MWRHDALMIAIILLMAMTGCSSTHLPSLDPLPVMSMPTGTTGHTASQHGFVQASAQQTASDDGPSQGDPFANSATLQPDRLVQLVDERNRTLEQMRATAVAASTRLAQVISLDDPNLSVSTAPGSIWSNNVDYAARVELTQKLPFFGKLALRGQMAQADAQAAQHDFEDMRLQLIELAWDAFADYYMVERALNLNEENLKRTTEYKKNAEAGFRNGKVPQQDMLLAEVERARLQERTLNLHRARAIAQARINTLMHLPPDHPLPPPQAVSTSLAVPDPKALRERAIAQRPDLKALANRVESEKTALALAVREYKPDFELMAAYDGFWQGINGRPLEWQLGAKVNLPVRLSRREAVVAEARARLAARKSELERATDQLNLQIQSAYAMVQESVQLLELYQQKLFPAAEANVKEALALYINSKVPFVTLIDAQRNLIVMRDRHNEVLADALRRKANLVRAVGGILDK